MYKRQIVHPSPTSKTLPKELKDVDTWPVISLCDDKRWAIPNDKIILQRLREDYTKDGATIIDRLPNEDFDYHKNEELSLIHI